MLPAWFVCVCLGVGGGYPYHSSAMCKSQCADHADALPPTPSQHFKMFEGGRSPWSGTVVLTVLRGFDRLLADRTDPDGRLGGDLCVRRGRSGPVWKVLAVILVDSNRLGGDLRVRRVRSGPVWTVLAVILVDSGRLGRRSPCTESAVRTGLNGFGGHFGRFRSVGSRSPST